MISIQDKFIFQSFLISFILYICNGLEKQIFSASVWNEATIYDFIEDDVFFEVLYPEELSYTFKLRQARGFGTNFKSHELKGVRLVIADPSDCCSFPHNSQKLQGAVALVTRGYCSFVSKAIKAEKAGALAVIVSDSNAENDELYIEMIDDNTQRTPNIPAAFLLGKNGYMIRKTLYERREDAAIINIPVNLTSFSFHQLNQPPWIVW